MKTGQLIELNITEIAAGGDGVGRYEGMAVFVPHTCRGERIQARITRIKSSCAFGEVVSLLETAPCRREDFCALSGRCGGCDFSHLTYEEQLLIKEKIVRDALERIGGFSQAPVEKTMPSPRAERYRNKMVFPLGRNRKGEISGGFYAPASHNLVPLTDCRQGHEDAALWLKIVTEHLRKTGTSVYDEGTHKGFARRVFIRLAEATKEAMVVLTATGHKLKNPKELVEKLRSVATEYRLESIILNIHKEPNNLLLGKENHVLYGRDYIEDVLGGLTFHISPHSFYQINPSQIENLYETALSLAELSGKETVLDLYCGIGTISLFAAGRAARVIGVEVVPQAIADAKENALRNGIENVEFLLGKSEELAPKLSESGNRPDVIILDPPRKGAEQEALSAILTMAPERVVYVSCNPATLARDAAFLCQHGYSLQKAIPADMFPNTSHIEAVALLCRVMQ